MPVPVDSVWSLAAKCDQLVRLFDEELVGPATIIRGQFELSLAFEIKDSLIDSLITIHAFIGQLVGWIGIPSGQVATDINVITQRIAIYG